MIVAPAQDAHALAVQAVLRRRGVGSTIFDTGRLPSFAHLTHRPDATDGSAVLEGMPLDGLTSVWWRRFTIPDMADVADPEERRFTQREVRMAFVGMLLSVEVPIVNHPTLETQAAHKPYQLRMARSAGLSVPRTVITNDPSAVHQFRSTVGGEVIFKALSATTIGLTDTRPLTDELMAELWRLRFGPMIVQEYIPLGRDLRVTMIGEQCFSAEIRSDKPAARYDWRLDQGYSVIPTRLDPEVEASLQRLRRSLGLATGSADLRQSPDGEYYLLEINPSGQFAFLEAYADIPVLDAFADLLAGTEGAKTTLASALPLWHGDRGLVPDETIPQSLGNVGEPVG